MKRAAMAMSVVTLLLAMFAVPPAAAQRPVHSPNSAFQARFGYMFLSGDSNFWQETGEVFTLDASDLDGFVMGFSYVHSMSNAVELGGNWDFYQETTRSRYRDYVDSWDNPIYHDTELSIMPVTVDVRFIPGGRYRLPPGGRFTPKPVFYIGAGAGLSFWEYREYGDFVAFAPDGEPEGIFRGSFADDGAVFEIHALAGVELPMSRSANLLFEARYSIADDELDLGGTSIFAGFSFRF